MAGALTFTLGLEVQNFLQGLGISSAKILSLAGAMEGLRSAGARMWEQIERGGSLYDLSNRTGESVRSLYQLQEAFKEAGLSSEAVGPMLLRMQKALSGMDEMGVKTAPVFERLGLDMEKLKTMTAPQQLDAVAAALAKMPKEEAVTLAGKLVGREGAGDLMQMARDIKGSMMATMADTEVGAGIFKRAAEAFDKIGDTLGAVKRHIAEMWAALAEAAAPAIQKVLDLLSRITAKIRDITAAFGNAFKAGEGLEMARAALDALVESFGNAFFGMLTNGSLWAGVGDAMLGAFSYAIGGLGKMVLRIQETFQALVTYGLGKGIEAVQNMPLFKTLMKSFGTELPEGWKAPTLEEARAGVQEWNRPSEDFLTQALDIGGHATRGAAENLSKGIQEVLSQSFSGPAMARFRELLEKYKAVTEPEPKARSAATRDTLEPESLGPRVKNATALEKIGFVFGNGAGAANDFAATTAKNTGSIVDIARRQTDYLAQLVSKVGPGSFANQ